MTHVEDELTDHPACWTRAAREGRRYAGELRSIPTRSTRTPT
ncbi:MULTISPECIES: hypothetical protein [unclassified Streptomyces]